jgi:RNA polymerase sigma-70 factor (ECF subfamily)
LADYERTAQFPTTSWSVIVQAKDRCSEVSREAIGQLCAIYWRPVFTFFCRKGLERDRALDCTQDFFTTLLEKDYLAGIERSKGRFRSFLLAAANHFLHNWFDAERALKRGGGRWILPLATEDVEGPYRNGPIDVLTPDALFEYQWARSLLDRTLQRLRTAYPNRDFEILKPFLVGEASRGDSAAAAGQLGLSDGAFKVAVHRLRKQYREFLRAEIAETVDHPDQVDDEIRYLLKILAQVHGNGL